MKVVIFIKERSYMNEIVDYNKKPQKIIIGAIIAIILLIGGGLTYFLIYKYDKKGDGKQTVASLTDDLKSTEKVEQEEDNSPAKTEETEKIKVDIKGAINSPGVYEVDEGTIVNELINMAGGIMSNATTKNMNLSRQLQNEMVVIIYTQNELETKENEISDVCYENDVDISSCYQEKQSIVIPSAEENTTKKDNNTSSTSVVSLNNASKEELMTLTGIGEAKALKIIEYRESNGGFKSIDELMNVKGIGEAIFNKIKNNLTL